MQIIRHKTRQVSVGGVKIGGNAPVSIQSMTKTRTADIAATVSQIKRLEKAGCEIVRLAIKDMAAAQAIKAIKSKTDIPLVADIHFHYQFALEAMKNGIDKIRLNPGNIYKEEEVRAVVALAKKKKIPIRVGVNSGSVPRGSTALVEAMVKCAKDYVRRLEKMDFYDVVLSLKCSEVMETVEAYRRIAAQCDYPLHLGLTASGAFTPGMIKSTLGLGVLLSEGIGDTIRVSLTAKPEEEVYVAKEILQALGLRNFRPELLSCPTCGRCEVDLLKMVEGLEGRLKDFPLNGSCRKPLRVAVMGCFVNGPGEAGAADLGVAFGNKRGLVFRRGKIIKRLKQSAAMDYLIKEIKRGQI
ncbi:MAG: flavodoxin-dependent (E)-4-hydroxy-3-methylbut-2-enyl-diphosphate synthase [Candidatus Omnitrophota bacterium]